MDNSTKQRLSQDDLARQNLTSKTLQPSYKTSSYLDTQIDSSWVGDSWARSFELAERDLEAYRTK
jgi:hypothetical protein